MNLCMGGVLPVWTGGGDDLHISLLLYRIYIEWPDYYTFRDHNNLATQCIYTKAWCMDSCTGGVSWPGLLPLTIWDPSGGMSDCQFQPDPHRPG